MPDLKAIKVELRWRIHADGEHSTWPDFKSLYDQDPAIFDGMRPSYFFDRKGTGWHYNKIESLGQGGVHGEAVCLIPKGNADQILAAALDGVTTVDEATLATWWDSKAYVNTKGVFEDGEALKALESKKALGIPLSPDDYAALDPDDATPGLRRNVRKTWTRYKSARSITVVS